MSASDSYWRICIPTPQGENCVDIGAEILEWPPDPEGSLKVAVGDLGRLQTLAGQVTDTVLRMRLIQALDEAALRLSTRLPAGTELRRSVPVAFQDDRGEFDGVPDVVGLKEDDGFNVLLNAGYRVTSQPDWWAKADEGTITGQSPRAGAANFPPTLVYVYVSTPVPPDPPTGTPPPPQIVSE